MKINKILAAGIAATLAVTSLSAVVSAEEVTKTFSMESTAGVIKFDLGDYAGEDLGRQYYLTDDEFQGKDGATPLKLVTVPGSIGKSTGTEAPSKEDILAARLAFDAADKNTTEFRDAAAAAGVSGTLTDNEDGTITGTYDTSDEAPAVEFYAWVVDDETNKIKQDTSEKVAMTWTEVKEAYEEAYNAYKEATSGVLATKPWTASGQHGQWGWDWNHPYADYIDVKIWWAEAPDTYDETTGKFKGRYLSEKEEIDAAEIKLVVKGVKGTRTASSKDYEYKLTKMQTYDAASKTDKYTGVFRLYIYEDVAPTGGFLPEQFLEITNISVVTTWGYENVVYDEDTYNKFGDTEWGANTNSHTDVVKAVENAAKDDLLTLINRDLNGVGYWYNYIEKSTKQMYAFLDRTENTEDKNEIIRRYEVKPLSATGAWNSLTLRPDAKGGYTFDVNQTYNEIDSVKWGTSPNAFGGLASQAATFFNKRTNGKIVFKFADPAATASGWVSGGIPSTEVGLKSALSTTMMALFINYDHATGDLQSDMGVVDTENLTITFDISNALDDMGGYTIGNIHEIYYGLMGGLEYKDNDYISKHACKPSIESKRVEYDKNNNTKTSLAKLEDNTDATGYWYVSDEKQHAVGYKVQEVVFSYDDASDVSGNTDEDDVDDEPIDDDIDDEPIDDDIDDEPIDDDIDDEPIDDDIDDEPVDDDIDDDIDDEPVIDDEPEIDDTPADDNNGTQIVVDTGDDDDANPGTGAALAVIPALIAAAGIAVSKKRK